MSLLVALAVPAAAVVNGDFSAGLDGWQVENSPGAGEVVLVDGAAELREGGAFLVSLRQTFQVPDRPLTLSFDVIGLPVADLSDDALLDAFEASLLDGAGASTVPVYREGATSYLNRQEDGTGGSAPGVTVTADGPITTITLDISALAPTTEVTFVASLIGADGDTGGRIRIDNLVLAAEEPPPTSSDDCLVGTRKVRLADRASVNGTVASFGTTELGSRAQSGTVVSGGQVWLRNQAAVNGDVLTGGQLDMQAGASVSGTVQENVTTLPLPAIAPVEGPAPGTETINVNAGATRTLSAGSYGRVTVNGNGRLVLEPGAYGFKKLIVNQGGVLEHGADTTFRVEETMTWRGDQQGSTPIDVGIAGTGWSHFESSWNGAVRGSTGNLRLAGNGGPSYAGAQFVGRELLVEVDVTVTCSGAP